MSTPLVACAMREKMEIIPLTVPSRPMSGASRAMAPSRPSRRSSCSRICSPARCRADSRLGFATVSSSAKGCSRGTAAMRSATDSILPLHEALSRAARSPSSGKPHDAYSSRRSTITVRARMETASRGHIIQPPSAMMFITVSLTQPARSTGRVYAVVGGLSGA